MLLTLCCCTIHCCFLSFLSLLCTTRYTNLCWYLLNYKKKWKSTIIIVSKDHGQRQVKLFIGNYPALSDLDRNGCEKGAKSSFKEARLNFLSWIELEFETLRQPPTACNCIGERQRPIGLIWANSTSTNTTHHKQHTTQDHNHKPVGPNSQSWSKTISVGGTIANFSTSRWKLWDTSNKILLKHFHLVHLTNILPDFSQSRLSRKQ